MPSPQVVGAGERLSAAAGRAFGSGSRTAGNPDAESAQSLICAFLRPGTDGRDDRCDAILAIGLLVFGWLAILRKGDLALLEHGLMMPVMLVPMFLRLDVYTGRPGDGMHGGGR